MIDRKLPLFLIVLLFGRPAHAQEVAKLVASDGADHDEFGAALEVSAELTFVGAPGADLPGLPDAGAVYVFERVGSGWTEMAKLSAAAPASGARFGHALDYDGVRLVVGAPESPGIVRDGFGNMFLGTPGAFLVFERVGSAWLQTHSVQPEWVYESNFADRVAIEGDRIIVKSLWAQGPSLPAGRLQFFSDASGTWSSTGQFFATDTPLSDIQVDGDRLVAGVPSNFGPGKAVVFGRTPTSWTLLQELTFGSAPDPSRFGARVAIDGDTVLVNREMPSPTEPIVAFTECSPGPYCQQSTFVPTGNTAGPGFPLQDGLATALVGDRAWIGLIRHAEPGAPDAGAVVEFRRSAGIWSEAQRWVASDAAADRRLGTAVASCPEFVVASTTNLTGVGPTNDAVYVFDTEDHAAFCFGDGADPNGCNDCPCANEAPLGTPAGCLNSAGRAGLLRALGQPSFAADSLRFEVESAVASTFALLLSADAALPQAGPCPPGSGIVGVASPMDGLRCIGGNLRRHGARSTDANGSAGSVASPGWGGAFAPAGGLLVQLGTPVGATRYFQSFYREDPLAGCGTSLNSTNAVAILLRP